MENSEIIAVLNNLNNKPISNEKRYEEMIRFIHQELNKKDIYFSEELKTRYENEKLASKELKQQAFNKHQKLYSKELDEKMQSLSHDNNELKQEMENLKHTYVTKLNLNKPH